jgi:hypothetical protein
VSEALVILHAMRMRRFVFCAPAQLYNIFPHYLIKGKIFGEKLLKIERVFGH